MSIIQPNFTAEVLRPKVEDWEGPVIKLIQAAELLEPSKTSSHSFTWSIIEQGIWIAILEGEIELRTPSHSYRVRAGEAIAVVQPSQATFAHVRGVEDVRMAYVSFAGEFTIGFFRFLVRRFGLVQPFDPSAAAGATHPPSFAERPGAGSTLLVDGVVPFSQRMVDGGGATGGGGSADLWPGASIAASGQSRRQRKTASRESRLFLLTRSPDVKTHLTHPARASSSQAAPGGRRALVALLDSAYWRDRNEDWLRWSQCIRLRLPQGLWAEPERIPARRFTSA